MKSKVGLFLLCFAVFLLGAGLPVALVWNPAGWQWADQLVSRFHGPAGMAEEAHSQPQLWTCGMDPQVIQDHPGNCPICGMKLVPLKDSGSAEPSQAAGGHGKGPQLWTCGMDPQVIQDHPGNCPICGMKLVPVQDSGGPPAGQSSQQKERKVKYWQAPMDPNYISDMPGKSPMGMDLIPIYEDEQAAVTGIRVDPNFVQNFAIRTAVVGKGAIPTEIRTLGILDYNEKNTVQINTKFEGWIEKASLNYIGEPVRKGQLLIEVYSPQLVTTQQEYLAAIEYVKKLSAGGTPESVERARALLGGAGERLRYWDISDDQIDELARSGKATRTLKIYSPVSGVLVYKMGDALEGMKIAPGMVLYKIADLSTVRAEIEVFERQIRFIRIGQNVQVTVDAFPGRRWAGRIVQIDPRLSRQTRTLKAYIEISNADGRLRPSMYANMEIGVPAISGVVIVPDEAILHSGERNVVVVQKDAELFEPREVELGASGGGYSEVRSGLSAGEVVVTSSQFLIDSESNLKEAINKILAARKARAAADTAPAPEHVH